MDEIWIDIPGYEGLYSVSSRGRVRSDYRASGIADDERAHRALRPFPNTKGYHQVALFAGGIGKKHLVSHLVAAAFIGKPPGRVGTTRGTYQLHHRNGVKTDNRPENLEWVTFEHHCRIHGDCRRPPASRKAA